MGIFSNVKAKLKLAKLKEQVDKDPTPTTIGELARYYIHEGDNDAAYALMERSIQSFPDSENLKNLWSYIRKSRSSGKVRSALETLENDPSPESYIAVIDTYRMMGDMDNAVEYGRHFAKEFPGSGTAHRILGEIRLYRFGEDFAAQDGRAAEAALKKALELDPDDSWAPLLLARLYANCGLAVRATSLLDNILEGDPECADALELKEYLDGMTCEEEDPDLRFSEVEERRGFYHDWAKASSESESLELNEETRAAIEEHLEKSMGVEGVDTATFIGREGMDWRTGKTSSESEWESFSDFVDRVTRSARKASLRMDIGAFERGIIEGPDGGIVIRTLKEGVAAFLLQDRHLTKKAYPALRDLVEEMAAVIGKSNERSPEESE